MNMKRILVVDDSPAVRETLSLILGREFIVLQRAVSDPDALPQNEPVDLLILGLSPAWAKHSLSLMRRAAAAPFAVLFLVDSRSVLQFRDRPLARRIDYLAKPFNPYELKEKVGRLLTLPASEAAVPLLRGSPSRARRYLDFPFIARAAAALAQRYALTRLAILIHGELGCGQDSVAQGLFEMRTSEGEWVALSCPALNDSAFFARSARRLQERAQETGEATLFLDRVEALDAGAQAALREMLDEFEGRGIKLRLLSAAHEDLLPRVYRGEFLDGLYYRLATLALHLPPLRDRPDDIPELAGRLALECGESLGLGPVQLAPDAISRLRHYLWFGNLREMETVIARTVAFHRKSVIGADDLLFGPVEELNRQPAREAEPPPRSNEGVAEEKQAKRPSFAAARNDNGLDLNLMVSELCHELKNPMVTIKTFSQLLVDRYDDPVFRSRFREMVSGDIERMDALLENLLEFARLAEPAPQPLRLLEQLCYALEEVLPDNRRSWIREELAQLGEDTEVFIDRDHLRYILKNVLRNALAEAQPKGEVDIHTESGGVVVISYAQESGKVVSLAQYLESNGRSLDLDHGLPSLRLLLAKNVLEKSGGKIDSERDASGNVRLRVDLPLSPRGGRAI
ncbi:MAG TPA: sigma 54-interacting transcriptional regulator [Candidatus Acidoferrales bacterium]|nr:sigma 54-interacting transcriptional regulator [Candidatus Acidoferrales bacterium]